MEDFEKHVVKTEVLMWSAIGIAVLGIIYAISQSFKLYYK